MQYAQRRFYDSQRPRQRSLAGWKIRGGWT